MFWGVQSYRTSAGGPGCLAPLVSCLDWNSRSLKNAMSNWFSEPSSQHPGFFFGRVDPITRASGPQVVVLKLREMGPWLFQQNPGS